MYLRHITQWFDIHIYCEVITTGKYINISITFGGGMVRTFMIFSLSNF